MSRTTPERPRPERKPADRPVEGGSSRPLVVRAVFALLVLVGATVMVLTSTPTLGLDLRGGTQVVLETQSTDTVEANAESTDRALEVIRRRVDALGVAETTVVRSGERRIVVEMPGLQDPRDAIEAIGRTAQLTFHEVLSVEAPGGDLGPSPDGTIRVQDEGGSQVLVLAAPALTGESVTAARAVVDTQTGGGWYVEIDFRQPGRTEWERITGEAACRAFGDPQRRVAIVLDDEVITSPEVGTNVPCDVGITGGTTTITGRFTQEEATELAALIQGGALPLPVEITEQRTVGPSLGQAAIDASVQAIIIGVALTTVFIVAAYRLMGALAIVALLCYALITYASLITLGATITLPGLAGFVLSVGMAVDANVLIYERSREEFATRGRSLLTSVREGFKRAFPAILDSNVTTVLAAGLLFFLASGPVRGFGVTLSLGVVVSFFSALVITRVLAELAARRKVVQRHPAVTGVHSLGRVREWLTAREPRYMDHARRWLLGSLVVAVVAGAGLVANGVNLGVEFTGGRSIQYVTQQEVDVDEARSAIAAAGFPDAVVQETGDAEITVRTGPIDEAQQEAIRDAVAELGDGAEVLTNELISASMGEELRRNAMIALGIALLAQLAYLAFRFRWTFSSGAVASLATNVLVVLGVFAWTDKVMGGVFLAALLTVIGYSVNDSVVVFDRIREMRGLDKETPFHRVAGTAVLQTLPRTVNTGLSTLLVLVALLVLGGESLSDFALALVLGIVVGTASTITVAVPLTVVLERRFPAPERSDEDDSKYADLERRRRRGTERSDGAVV